MNCETNIYFLIFHVPGAVLGSGSIQVSKTHKDRKLQSGGREDIFITQCDISGMLLEDRAM